MRNMFLLLSLLALAPAALADAPQLYKWTAADGVIHYSDKPPVQATADLESMDMPSFPARDPAEIAAHQAELDAEAQMAQKLLQTQLDQEAQAKALALQQAELEAATAAQQQAAPQPQVEPIYVNSVLVPRAYRANLYVHHRPASSRSQPVTPSHPAITMHKPR